MSGTAATTAARSALALDASFYLATARAAAFSGPTSRSNSRRAAIAAYEALQARRASLARSSRRAARLARPAKLDTTHKPLAIQRVLLRPAHASLNERVWGRPPRCRSGEFVQTPSALRNEWKGPTQVLLDVTDARGRYQVSPLTELLAVTERIDSPRAERIAAAQKHRKSSKRVKTNSPTPSPTTVSTARKEKLKVAAEKVRQFEEEEALEFSPRKLFGCLIAAFAPTFVVENVAKPLGLCN